MPLSHIERTKLSYYVGFVLQSQLLQSLLILLHNMHHAKFSERPANVVAQVN